MLGSSHSLQGSWLQEEGSPRETRFTYTPGRGHLSACFLHIFFLPDIPVAGFCLVFSCFPPFSPVPTEADTQTQRNEVLAKYGAQSFTACLQNKLFEDPETRKSSGWGRSRITQGGVTLACRRNGKA